MREESRPERGLPRRDVGVQRGANEMTLDDAAIRSEWAALVTQAIVRRLLR